MDSHIKTVNKLYEAFTQSDLDTILGLCADDVDWACEAAGGAAPWHGTRIGKDRVAGFFGGIAEALDVTEFTQLAIASNYRREVFALLRFGFTSKATGRTGTMNLHHYWRFNPAGQVECYRGSEDTALVAAVLGATPVAV